MEISWEASHGRELVERGTNVTIPLLFHMSEYQQQPLRIILVKQSIQIHLLIQSSVKINTLVILNPKIPQGFQLDSNSVQEYPNLFFFTSLQLYQR